jgi:hypothetical protein
MQVVATSGLNTLDSDGGPPDPASYGPRLKRVILTGEGPIPELESLCTLIKVGDC